MLLYLSNGHIFLWFGDKLRKIDGGDWGVHLVKICRSKNFFFWTGHSSTPKKLLPLTDLKSDRGISLDFPRISSSAGAERS